MDFATLWYKLHFCQWNKPIVTALRETGRPADPPPLYLHFSAPKVMREFSGEIPLYGLQHQMEIQVAIH